MTIQQSSSSTIYVKHTSRIHASSPASFGPHFSDPNGQPMNLVPIEFFLETFSTDLPSTLVDHSSLNQGCPPPADSVHSEYHRPTFNHSSYGHPQDWVALIERGTCTFVDKIRYAQKLGASAVIIGDWNNSSLTSSLSRSSFPRTQLLHSNTVSTDAFGFNSGLLTMYAPGDTSDVLIPSVFVARASYLSLRRDWKEFRSLPDQFSHEHDQIQSLQVIMSKDQLWTWPFFDLVIILLFLPSILTIVTLLLHRISTFRKKRADRAPRDLVNRLPSVIWAKDMEKGIPVIINSPNPPQVPQASPATQWISQLSECLRNIQPRFHPIILPQVHSEHTPLISSPKPQHTVQPVLRKSQKKVHFSQRECALCLSDFEVGDLIRILPCGHCFHQCHLEERCMGIDCWLLKSKRFCPICRMSILEESEDPSEIDVTPVNLTPTNTMDPILLGFSSEPIPLPSNDSIHQIQNQDSARDVNAPIPSSSSVTLDHACFHFQA